MKYCKNCEKELQNSIQFCPSRNAPMQADDEVTAMTENIVVGENTSKGTSKEAIISIYVCLAFVLAGIGCVCYGLDRTKFQSPFEPDGWSDYRSYYVSDDGSAYFSHVDWDYYFGQVKTENGVISFLFDYGYFDFPVQSLEADWYILENTAIFDSGYYAFDLSDIYSKAEKGNLLSGKAKYTEDGLQVKARQGRLRKNRVMKSSTRFRRYEKSKTDLFSLGFTTIYDYDPASEILTVTDVSGHSEDFIRGTIAEEDGKQCLTANTYYSKSQYYYISDDHSTYLTWNDIFGGEYTYFGQTEINGEMTDIVFHFTPSPEEKPAKIYLLNSEYYTEGDYLLKRDAVEDDLIWSGALLSSDDGITMKTKSGMNGDAETCLRVYRKDTVDLLELGFTAAFDIDMKNNELRVTASDGTTKTYYPGTINENGEPERYWRYKDYLGWPEPVMIADSDG